MTEIIELSDGSVCHIKKLCKRIARENPNNNISLKMADGISKHAVKKRSVFLKQAVWICRNADYLKEPPPKELVGIDVPKRAAVDNDSKHLIAKLKAVLREGDVLLKSLERNLPA